MSIPSPDPADVAALNKHYAFGVPDAELEDYRAAVTNTLVNSERVQELYAKSVPVVPDRAWSEPADNTLGAWYVTSEVRGAAEGPLHGRTVAVKDNVTVAGIPMANGSRAVEGFVPRATPRS